MNTSTMVVILVLCITMMIVPISAERQTGYIPAPDRGETTLPTDDHETGYIPFPHDETILPTEEHRTGYIPRPHSEIIFTSKSADNEYPDEWCKMSTRGMSVTFIYYKR